MKNILKFVLHYFLVILIFAVVGIFFNFLYDSSLRLVAGQDFVFDSFSLVKGFFIGLKLSIIFSACFMCLYRIRTGVRKLSLFFAYIFLGIFSWGIFYPAVLFFEQKVSYKQKTIQTPLTKSYFRETDSKIVYFVTDQTENNATIISVEKSSPSEQNVTFGNEVLSSDFIESSKPFSDPLIKKSFSDFPKQIFSPFLQIFDSSVMAMKGGLFSALNFLSFAFLLYSIYGFVIFSSWKLIDFCMIFCSTALIIALNSFYYLPAFKNVHSLIENSHFGIPGIEIVHSILNLTVGLLLIIFGCIIYFVRRRKL